MLVSKLKIQQFSRWRKIDVVIEFSARVVRRKRLFVSSGGDEIIPSIHHHASAWREMTLRPWLASLHAKLNNGFKERHMSPLSSPTTVRGLKTEAEFWIVSRREIGQSRSSDHSAVAAHKNPHLVHCRQSLTVVMFAGRVTSSSIPSSSTLLFPSTAAAWWPRYCVRYLTVIRVQLAGALRSPLSLDTTRRMCRALLQRYG